MEKQVRWGIIGAGGIADRRTIPGLQLCKHARLEAVMEITKELAQRSREKWGCPKAYDSIEALLADPAVDAVYIASPVGLHAAQVMAAADAGKHILVEKPLAMTADEGEAVVRHCREKGVLLAAGLMMRFGSYVQAMKAAVEDGKIGRPVSAYAQFTCWYPDMPGAWRQTKAISGGGALMDMGVHCIDLVQYILGSQAKEVAAFHDTLSFQYEVEDSSTVLLRLENGAQCVVQSNFNIPDEAAKWRIEIFGDKGRLVGEDVIGQVDGGTLDAVFVSNDRGYAAQQDKQTAEKARIDVQFGNAYTRELDSFSLSILEGTPLAVPAEDAVQVQRVIEAAYASNDTASIIQL